MPLFLFVVILFTASCASSAAVVPKADIILIGSTPAGAEVTASLRIDEVKPVDFIRWNLGLDATRRVFFLAVNFGEGQPNTRGFKGGGESRSFKGAYAVIKSEKGDVYKFTSDDMAGPISMVRLNDNLFHLLTGDDKLMVGNGGWGYTLNRKSPVAGALPASRTTELLNERFTETVFAGRTPCVDFGRLDLEAGADCRKLKWKLSLFRDAETNRPTTYKLESTVSRLKPVVGEWSFVNGAAVNPKALLIELDPNDRSKTISFLVGDENVLFLLDKNRRLLNGNVDFGFTLDRRVR